MLCLLTAPIFAQDKLEDKVSEFLELTGSKENFYMMMDQMIDQQKAAFEGAIDEEYFEVYRAKVKEYGYESIIEMIMPIYLKYYSEEELDGLLAFYRSDIGKSYIAKQPLMMQEYMATAAEWGEKLGSDIKSSFLAQSNKKVLEDKFSKVISEDLDRFKKGEFYFYNDDVKVGLIRKGNKQIERIPNESREFIIEWNSNNNYTIKEIKPNGDIDEDNPLAVNIYEAKENSYKCVAKINIEGNYYYSESEIFIAK